MLNLELLRKDYEGTTLDSIGVSEQTRHIHFIFKSGDKYIGFSVPESQIKTFNYHDKKG